MKTASLLSGLRISSQDWKHRQFHPATITFSSDGGNSMCFTSSGTVHPCVDLHWRSATGGNFTDINAADKYLNSPEASKVWVRPYLTLGNTDFALSHEGSHTFDPSSVDDIVKTVYADMPDGTKMVKRPGEILACEHADIPCQVHIMIWPVDHKIWPFYKGLPGATGPSGYGGSGLSIRGNELYYTPSGNGEPPIDLGKAMTYGADGIYFESRISDDGPLFNMTSPKINEPQSEQYTQFTNQTSFTERSIQGTGKLGIPECYSHGEPIKMYWISNKSDVYTTVTFPEATTGYCVWRKRK